VLHTEKRAAWDAKNRFALPAKIPLDFGEYTKAMNAARGKKAA
jgi:hypothetical protein